MTKLEMYPTERSVWTVRYNPNRDEGIDSWLEGYGLWNGS